jgi:hypothetical protein
VLSKFRESPLNLKHVIRFKKGARLENLCLHTKSQPKKNAKKHATAGIRWWSPTQLLICRSEACVWQSGRDAQFSSVYGRMCKLFPKTVIYSSGNETGPAHPQSAGRQRSILGSSDGLRALAYTVATSN